MYNHQLESLTEAFKKADDSKTWVLDLQKPFFKEIAESYAKNFARDEQEAEARDLMAIRLGNGRLGES